MMIKPYQQITIQDNGEPLVPIPLAKFAVVSPHPYQQVGADYGGRSPYYLRQGVIKALITAQTWLQQRYPGWRIQIFDAYRPVAVQQYMVDYTFASVVQVQRLEIDTLSPEQRQKIWEQVYQIWAVPSYDLATPPPHSTGAAVDVTLVDAAGEPVNMGSAIDELSPRSAPDYYADNSHKEQKYCDRRELLHQVMRAGGFRRHPGEWWHFSLGDQMWAWQRHQEEPGNTTHARYGRADHLG